MKFVHLSDLHIGKRVNEFSMLKDQKYILDEIVRIIKEQKVDGVVIAGDIYDKPVPSAEAVQLFDLFLTKLADLNLSVFIISGNHDSAERIAFGKELMRSRKVYVSSVFDGKIEPVVLSDDYGEVAFYLVPFIKPAYVRHAYLEEKAETYNEAFQRIMEHLPIEDSRRNVMVAHQFVTGALRCDSEEVSVGGMDNIDADLLKGFDYVALGHIHGPQNIIKDTIRYCGTPLKYSFSESRHKKSVTVVELKEKGNIQIDTIPLNPQKDMRELKGTYEELTALSFYKNTDTEDYIHITLTDEEDIPDVLTKLRVIYPNIMKLDYDNTRTKTNREMQEIENIESKSPMELFCDFYEQQNNQTLKEEQISFLEGLIERIWEV